VREARQSAAEEKKKRNVELEKQRGRWWNRQRREPGRVRKDGNRKLVKCGVSG
jgi:hypothetical protein